MNIKKLYKITKITPLSNPVANKIGIARIFRLFQQQEESSPPARKAISCLSEEKTKKYGRIKNTQLQQIQIKTQRKRFTQTNLPLFQTQGGFHTKFSKLQLLASGSQLSIVVINPHNAQKLPQQRQGATGQILYKSS